MIDHLYRLVMGGIGLLVVYSCMQIVKDTTWAGFFMSVSLVFAAYILGFFFHRRVE